MLTKPQIHAILAIIEQASQACLEVYAEEDFGVQTKSDNSPVTRADLLVNEMLTQALAVITPEIPVVSEEANIEFDIRKNYNMFWIIDPIDGTKEFIKKSGEFTINLGLIEDKYPVFGVIAIPCQKEIFWGGSILEGSYVCKQSINDNKPIQSRETLTAITSLGKTTKLVDITCSKDHRHPKDAKFIERVAQQYHTQLKPCGSTIKICRIAEGEADVYIRMGGINDWDLAAGHAIVEAAGGNVVDIDGNALSYNTQSQKLNPFIVFGKSDLGWTTFTGANDAN